MFCSRCAYPDAALLATMPFADDSSQERRLADLTGSEPSRSSTSWSITSPAASAAGRPTMGSGRGATRSSSASARGFIKDHGPERHAIDHDKPEEHLLARSLDGGLTWTIENPAETGALIPVGKALHGITPPGLVEKPWRDCPGGINFQHPDFALTVRMTDVDAGPSRFSYSTDRGHHWEGPFRLPLFGQPGIAARTDYLVNGPSDCMLFLTAAKADRQEGRPLCVRTTDGGRTWRFVSWIGPEPKGFAIMPATVRLGSQRTAHGHSPPRGREALDRDLSLARRRRELDTRHDSRSGPGRGQPREPDPPGRRPSLPDLRPSCRAFSIRARLSSDRGHRGTSEIILRDDGGGRDLGYPRSVQRPDGKVVTVYYFWDRQIGPGTLHRGHDLETPSELSSPGRFAGPGIMLPGGSWMEPAGSGGADSSSCSSPPWTSPGRRIAMNVAQLARVGLQDRTAPSSPSRAHRSEPACSDRSPRRSAGAHCADRGIRSSGSRSWFASRPASCPWSSGTRLRPCISAGIGHAGRIEKRLGEIEVRDDPVGAGCPA